MKVYISATEAISPQSTFLNKGIPSDFTEYSAPLKNLVLNFKDYFPPMQSRRINRLIKTCHICALETIRQSGIKKPDAIITGSGLGCVESTEKFLNDMVNTNEGLLAPTAFIQSTSNSIGANIALHYNCTGYNQLYAQKSFSFELALQDALLRLKDNEEKNILLGGFDELSIENCSFKQQVGLYKSEPFTNTDILNSTTAGSIPGEGSSFFVLTNDSNVKKLAEIVSVNMFPAEMSALNASIWINNCISKQSIDRKEIDLVLCGINGDKPSDVIYKKVLDSTFQDSTQAFYKHLCGEYDTATAFGTWFAIRAITENQLPEHSIILNKNRNINYVLIYNQQNSKYHSLTLLKRVNSK